VGCGARRKPIAAGYAPAPAFHLPPQPGCTYLRGTAKGNDALSMDLVLCPREGGYSAVAQLAGASGWSKRALHGLRREDGSFAMTDTALLESHAADGWEHCMGASYSFKATRNPKVFVGTYESSTCEDEAMLVLEVRDLPAQAAVAEPSAAAQPPASGPPTPEPTPRTTGSELDVDAATSTGEVNP
jgi:hypothetical protein